MSCYPCCLFFSHFSISFVFPSGSAPYPSSLNYYHVHCFSCHSISALFIDQQLPRACVQLACNLLIQTLFQMILKIFHIYFPCKGSTSLIVRIQRSANLSVACLELASTYARLHCELPRQEALRFLVLAMSDLRQVQNAIPPRGRPVYLIQNVLSSADISIFIECAPSSRPRRSLPAETIRSVAAT